MMHYLYKVIITSLALIFMDDTDLTITSILSGNSRMSYQKLAGMLNLSVNAVHKRVKNLLNPVILENS